MAALMSEVFGDDVSNAISSDNELEDEAMGQMMKRISVAPAPRPSALQPQRRSVYENPQRKTVYDGLQGQQQQRPSAFAQQGPSQRRTVTIPQNLGDMEDDEDAARSAIFDVRDVMPQLRQEAEQSDAKAERYSALIQQGLNLVSEVKSALYDADNMSPDSGAELLLDEVRQMLMNVTQTSLAEAAQLQKTSENWLGIRRKIGYQLRVYHNTLEASIERRAETARASNAENRAECDRLWRQIQDLESEVDSLPRLRGRGSISDVGSPNGSEFSANVSGGLTLEGAHSLLRSFNAALRPHMSEIIPENAELRSSSEAIALEFLNACKESMKQVPAPDAIGNKSPVSPEDPYSGDLLQEEQRTLLQSVGQSY